MTKSFCGSVAYLAPEMLEKQGHGFTLDWYLLGVLTYELINGLPPFYCKNQSQLFNNILKGELTFSRVFSNRAQTFIKDLMNKDPKKRLGCTNDAEDIKSHIFFKGIKWDDVYQRNYKMPII